MRLSRVVPLAFAAIAVLALAACAGASSAPGWTYAPAPSAAAAPSGEPGGSPATSAEPSVGAPASAEPSGSAGPGGEGLEVTAANITFDPKELSAPADQPFSIRFLNNDTPGAIHDIDIRDSAGQTLQDQPTTEPGQEATYEYTPLAAGQYTFICSIHPIPNMTGTLTVE